jgi:hypothetical protein
MNTENIPQREAPEVAELLEIAQEAYIWGSPLVQFGEYRRLHAFHYQPLNRVVAWLNLIEDYFAPSFEVLYSYIDFELSEEPQILSVPKIKGRYDVNALKNGSRN